ncbi:error-prone DNA polymerase [Rugamonas sp. A1-17]|nr:error-prone DNA polymerase [Rugamonas sp. A1-17]
MLPAYAELQCVSHYTFLRGASSPQQLVDRAKELGYDALAVTDECTMAGAVKAHMAAKAAGLKLVIGSQMMVTPTDGSAPFALLILAMNKDGYGNLCELITAARMRAPKGEYLVRPNDIAAPPPDLAALRGMPGCQLVLLPRYGASVQELEYQAAWLLHCAAGRSRIAMTLHFRATDDEHRDAVEQVSAQYGLPVVATGDVVMHVRSFKPVQDTMTAIRHGLPVDRCGRLLAPNAEQHLRQRLRLANLYAPAALQESVRLANLCDFSLDELRYEYPQEIVPEGETATSYLRTQAYLGAHWRFPGGIPDTVQNLLEKELTLIAEMAYENYFLTVYDIVRFARSNNILCQGRGSAANSAVCFCLGVTEVDPSRGTMLFERFISKERDEPPDIDVDFEHQRREEVIQYLYAKYGRTRAALTAVVTSYRPKSVLRDVGRALGVDLSIVEKVAGAASSWSGQADLRDRMVSCGFDPDSPVAQKWGALAEHMMSFPRHMSQHPGGFVLARTKLSRLVPVENASMEGRTIIQWDKDDIDAVGLLKVDVLALGMLSAIQRALEIISAERGERFELKDIPAEDAATYDMISKGDTIGVFQIESRAQMAMLPRMKPRTFYDLVIEVAIIRPGPIQGGMIHPYLRRREGTDPVVYPSKEMESVLSRTLGIPIFQEQVMQIAMVAAGFTPGEADQLRRAMAAWKRKGGLEHFETKLMTGMAERGYTADFAAGIVGQIRGFAEYGFPESHAASFALLAYASSWLKRHEAAAFLAALLNSQPMGFYSPSQLVQDARRHGVVVLGVDVMVSHWEAVLETVEVSVRAVRLGFNTIRGMQREAAWRIEEARAARSFANVHDLAVRAALNEEHLKLLAAADALAAMTGNRRQAMWVAAGSSPDRGLLREAAIDEMELVLQAPTDSENTLADYHNLGLTLGRHPLSYLRPRLHAMRLMTADVLHQYDDARLARGCGLVTVRQRPATANGTVFITLEDETGNVNVIVWPSLVEQQRREVMGARLLAVYGQWQSKNGVSHLVAKRLVDLTHMLGELSTRSRDFH